MSDVGLVSPRQYYIITIILPIKHNNIANISCEDGVGQLPAGALHHGRVIELDEDGRGEGGQHGS